jgi:hypothetical protein
VQPIHGVAPATEYDRRRRPRIWHACAAPLVRFRLLQHCPAVRVHCVASPRRARVCLTRSVPSSGFLTLSTASSSVSLPGLVSCRSALGVPSPTELFPRPEPERLSTFPLPSCRWSRLSATRRAALGTGQSHVERSSDPVADDSASRLCSPVRVRCASASGEADGVPDALLGFGPLQGFLPRGRAGMLPHRLLPRASRWRRVETAAEAAAPIYS